MAEQKKAKAKKWATFLDLPGELRDEIYTLTLVNPERQRRHYLVAVKIFCDEEPKPLPQPGLLMTRLWETWFYSFPDVDKLELELEYYRFGYASSHSDSEEDGDCSEDEREEDEHTWQMMGKNRRRATEEAVEHYLGSISSQYAVL